MFNNFIEYEYQPYHKIYLHQSSNYGIYLGDVSSALDLNFIKSEPIRTVVTAAVGMDQVSYEPSASVNHIIYPLLDAKSQNITKFFDQFYQLIEKQILQGNILVHCAAGISRSATLVISYFMKKNNWGFKQSIKFVRQKRPIVLPNLGFERQLKQYEGVLSSQQSRDTDTSQWNKRIVAINSSQVKRAILSSPFKNQILPDIKTFGQTALIRSKALERGIHIRMEPTVQHARQIANRKLDVRTRKSEHDYKQLKKKSNHFANFDGRDSHVGAIFAKIQSGRTKLLQRSNNLININVSDTSDFNYAPAHGKKLSSLSHRSEKRSQQLKLRRNYSNNKTQKQVNLFDDMNKLVANKLQLNERKFLTQKNLRTRGINRLALQF